MAKIYPERLPQSILDDPLRSAERKVYQALQSLPNKYVVFYSVHWQNFDNRWEIRESEADFVIIHPDMGIISLEVKGGSIRYDGGTGQWYSYGRNGEIKIKDPVDQARDSHYAIRDKLRNFPGWDLYTFNIWHAVCFPDAYKHGQEFRPDLPIEQVIGKADLDDIENAIARMFKYLFENKLPSGAPGAARMNMIINCLAPSFEMTSPLGVEMDYEDEKLVQLTDQQFYALSILGDRKRAAIAGCAGSGKTMLAVRKAQQFTEMGMSVLLVCYNIALAEDLRRRLPNIEVYNFHELCRKAANQVGYSIRNVVDENELFNVILPDALLEASDQIGRIYDAIIVDEAQDFQENYWIALESLLKEDGYFYIFFDNNQNLYGGVGTFSGLIIEQPFVLNQNCRNTKAIHEVVAKFHNKPESLLCFGPLGRNPEMIQYNGEEDLLRQLQKLLHHLVVEEHVDNDEIVILTPRGERNTKLVPGLKLGLFTLTNQTPNHMSKIQATSVYKFKGLERKVVILAEIDNRTNFNRDMIMYVGCSRARTELIILSDESAPDLITERLKPGT